MEPRECLIALHEISGVGWASIASLISKSDNWFQLMGRGGTAFRANGISQQISEIIAREWNERNATITLQKYEEKGIRVITIFDEEYPQWLRHIPKAPWVLYAIGRIELLQSPSIAIVGTRTPTVYGKKAALEFAQSLVPYGLTITSGLARGVDGEAHRGALKSGGGTIAVLGCSVNTVYPKEHLDLYKQIATNGLLLSEYPIGTIAHPGLFPQRNRIISGLSLGTLVIEAAARSGSLITADFAYQQNREVFALPGSIYSPRSMGTNELLTDRHAIAVTEVEHIVREYRNQFQFPHLDKIKREDHTTSITSEEKNVLHFIQEEPITLDELHERTETKFGHLHTILLSLALKNLIEQLPGPSYRKK